MSATQAVGTALRTHSAGREPVQSGTRSSPTSCHVQFEFSVVVALAFRRKTRVGVGDDSTHRSSARYRNRGKVTDQREHDARRRFVVCAVETSRGRDLCGAGAVSVAPAALGGRGRLDGKHTRRSVGRRTVASYLS